MQSPIANDCLNVFIDSNSEPQLVTKLLLQLFIQEIHNIMVCLPEEGLLKEVIYVYNNIIISDSTI